MEINFATTTMPTILFWALGLLVFLFGGMLGYFNMAIDARKKAESADLKVENAREEARRKLSEAEQIMKEAQALKDQAPQTVSEPVLLKLKNDENFRVQIEMDGKPLAAPLTPERKKRLFELIAHVRPWIESETTPSQVSPPQFDPAPSAPHVSSPPESFASLPVTTSVKPVSVAFPLTPQKPKTDPETEFKLLSIVKQIDAVLQKRILGTQLEPLGIHLQETPRGGLEVVIGTKKFDAIDDVPDANIKNAIRAAIAEWEQKYVPGA